MTLLIDVHHIGGRQTGNETLARNIGGEIARQASPGEAVFAACAAGAADVAALTGVPPRLVADRALRRVGVDLPALARDVDAQAVLVHYTKPRTRRPCVVMVHDLSPFDPRSAGWLSWRFRTRVRMSIDHSARSAAALIVPSEFTRQGLLDRYSLDPEQVVLAPSAVDPELARLLDAAGPAVAFDEEPQVTVVGNVVARKNLLVLARAVAGVRAAGVPARLRVVGSVPPASHPIAESLKKVLGDAVTFSGYVSTEGLVAEYKQAHVLAFPSLFEGFGIPAIEAMYAGVPVLVADAGSLPEVVGGAGVVLAADDVAAWTGALTSVLTAPAEAQRLRELGHDRARATSWPSSAAIVLQTLRHAAGSQ